MEVKYTSNGKKVVVIGNLNAQEKIVQEIFIVNGQEVPSGENFVVKSLHDAPAISWEEKRTKEIKEQYEKVRKEFEKELDSLKRTHRDQTLTLRKFIESNAKMLKNVSEDSFNTLISFLCGDVKWIVRQGYGTPKVAEYGVNDSGFDRELKLLTLYGRDDGTLQWKMNYYSDGSGGSEDVFLFGDKESALEKFKELVVGANYYTSDTFVIAKEYGLILDKVKVAKYRDDSIKHLTGSIAKNKESIEKAEKELQTIDVIIPKID